jgi:hypothetical protein
MVDKKYETACDIFQSNIMSVMKNQGHYPSKTGLGLGSSCGFRRLSVVSGVVYLAQSCRFFLALYCFDPKITSRNTSVNAVKRVWQLKKLNKLADLFARHIIIANI